MFKVDFWREFLSRSTQGQPKRLNLNMVLDTRIDLKTR